MNERVVDNFGLNVFFYFIQQSDVLCDLTLKKINMMIPGQMFMK